MKIKQVEVTTDNIELSFVGDTHIGHRSCYQPLIQTVADYIQKERSSWVGLGDYGDSIIPGDSRFDYNSIDPDLKIPQEQYDYFQNIFDPVSKRCIGLLDGNHDLTNWKKHCHNYVDELSKDLNTTYLTISAYIRLHFTKTNRYFDIYCHHGWAGGKTKSGSDKSISDLANIYPNADLYVMGHVHRLGLTEERASLFTDRNLEIQDKYQYFAFSGSFLRGYVKGNASYVEEKGYRPNILGALTVSITPRQEGFKVDMGAVR